MISLERQGGKLSTLVILSALVSVQLAQTLNSEQLELLSAFFEVLGDDLALLALSANAGDTIPPANRGPAEV